MELLVGMTTGWPPPHHLTVADCLWPSAGASCSTVMTGPGGVCLKYMNSRSRCQIIDTVNAFGQQYIPVFVRHSVRERVSKFGIISATPVAHLTLW